MGCETSKKKREMHEWRGAAQLAKREEESPAQSVLAGSVSTAGEANNRGLFGGPGTSGRQGDTQGSTVELEGTRWGRGAGACVDGHLSSFFQPACSTGFSLPRKRMPVVLRRCFSIPLKGFKTSVLTLLKDQARSRLQSSGGKSEKKNSSFFYFFPGRADRVDQRKVEGVAAALQGEWALGPPPFGLHSV